MTNRSPLSQKHNEKQATTSTVSAESDRDISFARMSPGEIPLLPNHPTTQNIRLSRIQQLQHLLGNKRTQHLIQRDVSPGPIIIDLDAQRAARRQQIADQAMRSLLPLALVFLNEWHTAAIGALTTAQEPAIEEAVPYWWIALAGNLAWAATSLFTSEYTAIIRVLSFAGAAVGSGTVQQIAPPMSPPISGREAVGDALARARDQLDRFIYPTIEDTAIDCALNEITNPMDQTRALWQRLFPGIPYDRRAQRMREDLSQNINRALQQFMEQYTSWRALISQIAHTQAREEMRHVPSEPPGEPGAQAARASHYQILYGTFYREVEQANPFRPHLEL